jgi:hypothetical protein
MDQEVMLMRRIMQIGAILALTLAACNYTEGQCWIDGEGDGNVGAGGRPVTPGWGGYGDIPPKPQDVADPPPPDCNVVKDTACNEKCLADYTAAAEKCTEINDAAQKRTCDENAYARYKSCRENCTKQENDCKKCKLECDAEHDRCHAKCKDAGCHAKCNEEYGKCLKQCGDCPH